MPRLFVSFALLVMLGGGLSPVWSAVADSSAAGPPRWSWPVAAPRVVAPFAQPAHPYAAGHRGIDLDGSDLSVFAPADGVVLFVGRVVDRAVVTIDHGDGWVSSFEPVSSTLGPGDPVRRGQDIGEVTSGGHTPSGAMHFGVRLFGEYVSPLVVLGGVPRAVLLPCC